MQDFPTILLYFDKDLVFFKSKTYALFVFKKSTEEVNSLEEIHVLRNMLKVCVVFLIV